MQQTAHREYIYCSVKLNLIVGLVIGRVALRLKESHSGYNTNTSTDY